MKRVLLTIVFALSATSVLGQTNVYVTGGFGIGKLKFNESDFGVGGLQADLEDEAGLAPGALDGTIARATDTKDSTWNIAVGYRFHRNFAAELGYIDLGKYSARYTGSGVLAGGSVNANYEVSGWKLTGVGMLPVGNNFSFLGKLGFARLKAENRATVTFPGISESETGKKTKTRVMWGIGGQYEFNKNIGLRLEYEDYGKVGNEDDTGRAKVSTVNLNLVYSF